MRSVDGLRKVKLCAYCALCAFDAISNESNLLTSLANFMLLTRALWTQERNCGLTLADGSLRDTETCDVDAASAVSCL